MGRFIFPKSTKWRSFSLKHVQKKQNVKYNFKFIPSSYIKNVLEIVVKLKIRKKNAGLLSFKFDNLSK